MTPSTPSIDGNAAAGDMTIRDTITIQFAIANIMGYGGGTNDKSSISKYAMAVPVTIEKDWITQAGLRAIALLIPNSHRCGYVAVPVGHLLHGKTYEEPDISVHGGLTFSEAADHTGFATGTEWWFGFDCAHAGDGMMYYTPSELRGQEPVRTLEFVEQECESMARQLSEKSGPVVTP